MGFSENVEMGYTTQKPTQRHVELEKKVLIVKMALTSSVLLKGQRTRTRNKCNWIRCVVSRNVCC